MTTRLHLFGPVLCGVLLLVLLAPHTALGFCIYNKTDRPIKAIQRDGNVAFAGFKATINPGSKACCNWKNAQCNNTGHKDNKIPFDIRYFTYKNWDDEARPCGDKNVIIRADGWIKVRGDYPKGHCETGH